ncbi:MAG: tail fiber domain-containing protein [Burkholderiales bacterium]|nr:tail fiber domain-containing protein [Opitutaceae bacterium]
MNRLPALLAALALLVAAPLSAQTLESPPASIDYQGRVLDVNGNPLVPTTPTNYTMQFRIYSTATGGTALWTESQIVTVDNGNFSVRLGEGVAVGSDPRPGLATLFDAKDRYLGLTVIIPNQTPGEISPRLQFLTTPYAMTAQKATFATRATTADSVAQTGGNSTLGATTVGGNLSLSTPSTRLALSGNNLIELGAGVAGKHVNAGTISYGTLTTPNTLDIVGAGTNATNRAVKIFAEAGTTFTGPVRLAGTNVLELGQGLAKGQNNGNIGYGAFTPNTLDIVGAGSTDLNRAIKMWANSTEFTGNLFFGSRTSQLLNLYGTNYGVGVQTNTLYQRSALRFGWHVGGSHVEGEDQPGPGGTRIMTLQNGNGLQVFANKSQGNPGSVTIGLQAEFSGGLPAMEFRAGVQNPSGGAPELSIGYLDFSGSATPDFDVRMVAYKNASAGSRINFQNLNSSGFTITVNDAAVALQSFCDLDFKKEIEPYRDGLDTLLALAPVSFEWRRDEFPSLVFPAGRHVGLIAQDLAKVVPDAVMTNFDGKLSVDFSKLVPHLVGAVQTQQARIDKLEADNAALESRLSRLEAALARLDAANP